MLPQFRSINAVLLGVLIVVTSSAPLARCDDWTMFGRDATRNAVSSETNPPVSWDIETGRNIKWTAPLGGNTLGDPVVSDGLVWVGTNNYEQRRTGGWKDASVLKCFRATDGKLLYEYVSPRLALDWQVDCQAASLSNSPLIEGDRVWFTTNRFETVCLDIGPLLRGKGQPRVKWKFDMLDSLGIEPRGPYMGWARSSSVAGWKNLLYVITGHGTDRLGNLDAWRAPSLVCLDKQTGKLKWEDCSPGMSVLFGQWATPLVAKVKGRVQVIVPQGDGWLRSFDPQGDGKGGSRLLWEFDMNPKESRWGPFGGGGGSRNSILSAPVLYDDRVYLAVGLDIEKGEGPGRLCCIDPSRSGDISSELAVDAKGNGMPHRRLQAVIADNGEQAIPNPNSGLIWEFIKRGDEHGDQMLRTASNVAIAVGLVIAPDQSGFVHCLDAESGEKYWTYDAFADVLGSPLIVDDRIYIGDRDGEVAVLSLSADPNMALPDGDSSNEFLMDHAVNCSPVYANGTLYIATQTTLYAIENQDAKKIVRGNWPQWRGPRRDNISNDIELLAQWPDDGPPFNWRVEGIGEGVASMAVADGRVITLGYIDDGEYAVALDERTGERLWHVKIGPAVREQSIMRWLSQRTPTIDDDRVYVFTAGGQLACLQVSDGHEIWRRDYIANFKGRRGRFGYCDFPLIDGENLICTPGGQDAAMVALNRITGEKIWQCRLPEPDPAAHAAVVVAEIEGVRQYINVLNNSVIGVDAKNGELLWRQTGTWSGAGNTYPPIVTDNRVFCPGSYRGGVILTVEKSTEGLWVTSPVKSAARFQPWLASAVQIGQHVYAVDQTIIFCLDAATGQYVWRKRLMDAGKGRVAVTYAEDCLYVRSTDGTVMLIEVTPDGHQIRSRFRTPQTSRHPTWTFPVVTGGRMYLRDQHVLDCYDVRAGVAERMPDDVITRIFASPEKPRDRFEERIFRKGKNRAPDAIYVPTPQDVVVKMLELASVTKDDIVCDLGSGDGRIVITAAREYGCRAVGYEIDRDLVALSQENVANSGLTELVKIEHEDIFTRELSGNTVITVFLYPRLMDRLLPQLNRMKPGSRVVSHHFVFSDIPPDRTLKIESKEDGIRHDIHLWKVPLQAGK